MARRDPRVTRYIDGRAPFARPLLRRLRRDLHAGSPVLEEAIKWGMPAFLYRGKIVCGIAGFKAHCALWFKDGAAVVGAKPSAAMGQFGRITTLRELPSAARLKAHLRKAVAHIDGALS